MARVAFAGLGVMGFHMAAHLARAGHELVVYNRSSEKSAAWMAHCAGRVATSPREAADGVDAAFCCLGNDDSVRAVVLGDEGLLAGMREGALLVDHTTASATLARELHALAAARGVGFVDAPVSGGQIGAERGQLTIMAGGEERHFRQAEPLMNCYARALKWIGPPGSGQLAKMVNQICVGGVVAGLAEGLHFALCAGLDAAVVIDAISKGAAQSWQMDNRHATMLAGEYEHGFAVDWMRKDLGIVLDEARRSGASLPATALVDQLYAEVQAMGGGRWDTSSLLERLERLHAISSGDHE